MDRPGIVETADPRGTHVFLKMRASKQLSGTSQRKIAVTWERKIPKYDGANWVWIHDGAHHRNPAWAIADMLRNPYYSVGLPDSRIDLTAIQALAAICEARQDRFDRIYDSRTTIWDALAMAARCARAVTIMRRGVYSFVRDYWQDLPVAMFTPRNMAKDSYSIANKMPEENTPDDVKLRYQDLRFFDERTVVGQYWSGQVYAYVEGYRPAGVPAPRRVEDVPFPGITGLKHALREASYIIADSRFRRAMYTWQTDSEGLMPAYASLVAFSHDLPGFGQNADVFTYDVATLTLRATQPLTWTADAQHYVRLKTRIGGVTDPISVARGISADEMILASVPGFDVVEYDDAELEPTMFVFGPAENVCKTLKMKAIRPRGEGAVEMTGLIDDKRVHDADNAFLPAAGETQDAISYGNLRNAVMPSTNSIV